MFMTTMSVWSKLIKVRQHVINFSSFFFCAFTLNRLETTLQNANVARNVNKHAIRKHYEKYTQKITSDYRFGITG